MRTAGRRDALRTQHKRMHALVRAVQGDSGPKSPLLCSHLAATRGREQRSEVVSVAMASDNTCQLPLALERENGDPV